MITDYNVNSIINIYEKGEGGNTKRNKQNKFEMNSLFTLMFLLRLIMFCILKDEKHFSAIQQSKMKVSNSNAVA